MRDSDSDAGADGRAVMVYHKPKTGEWVAPIPKGYKFRCCDCGLVHQMDFRVVEIGKGKQIQFRAERDNRATAQVRRRMAAKARASR